MPPDFRVQDAPSLGLRIVSLLTDQVGGKVEFTSSPGVGTSFIVTVPTGDLNGADSPRHTLSSAIGQKEP
jgi:signal transduction histidine kinase